MYERLDSLTFAVLDAIIQIDVPNPNDLGRFTNVANELRTYLNSRVWHEKRVFCRPSLSPVNAVRAHLGEPNLSMHRADAFIRLQISILEKMSKGLELPAEQKELLLRFLLELHGQTLNELSQAWQRTLRLQP